MKASITVFVIIIILLPLIAGCATIMRGYEDTVKIQNAPDSLRVFSKDNIEIPVTKRTVQYTQSVGFSEKYVDKDIREIRLRTNTEHVLTIKSGDKEKRVYIYPKLNAGWFILDAILVVPFFVDAYTGNWNSFDDVDASF